jgi:rhamnosyl/mannosyltransferase
MRVLHVYRTYFPETQGGAEEVIRQICRNTSEHGIESRVLTLCKKPVPKVVSLCEADVYRYQNNIEIASCGFSFNAILGFRKLIKWADVVNYHYPYPFSDMLHCTSNVTAKTVVTYHSDIIRQKKLMSLYSPLMNKFLHQVDRIVATSPNYFATSQLLNHFKEKVEVISLGIDNTSYPAINLKCQKKISDQIGKDFFLFVGVLRYYKGLHILIDALKNSHVKAVIAGAGPVEGELKERVEKLGLKNIIFLGHVSDQEKVDLIKLSRAIVFPSYLRSEAFGVTLIEGAMFGKPLISTEIGTGTSYVNIHNKTGFVISPGSSEELKAAMEYLDENPDIAFEMGKVAKRRYLKLFTGKRMGKKYADLYMRLLTNQKGLSTLHN